MAELAAEQRPADHKDDIDFEFELDEGYEEMTQVAGDDFDLEFDDGAEGVPSLTAAQNKDTEISGITGDDDGDIGDDVGHYDAVVEIEYHGEDTEHADADGDAAEDIIGRPSHGDSNSANKGAGGFDEFDEINYDDDEAGDSSGNVNPEQPAPATEDPDMPGYGHDDVDNGVHDDDNVEKPTQEESTVYFDTVGETELLHEGDENAGAEQQGDISMENQEFASRGTEDHDATANAEGDMSSDLDHGGDVHDESSEAASPPEVKVIYNQEEYSLFCPPGNQDPNSYFLSNVDIIDGPLSRILSTLRDVLSDDIPAGEEILVRVDELGLEFGEVSFTRDFGEGKKTANNAKTMTRDFLDEVTFGQILDLHDRLVKNDNPEAAQPLYVYLLTRPNCTTRFADLMDGASSGHGLSKLAKYYESGPAAPAKEFPNVGSEDDGTSQDETPEDSNESSVDDGMADAMDEGAEEESSASHTEHDGTTALPMDEGFLSQGGDVSQPDADYGTFELGEDEEGSYHDDGGEGHEAWNEGQDDAAQGGGLLDADRSHESDLNLGATPLLDIDDTAHEAVEDIAPMGDEDVKLAEEELLDLGNDDDGKGLGDHEGETTNGKSPCISFTPTTRNFNDEIFWESDEEEREKHEQWSPFAQHGFARDASQAPLELRTSNPRRIDDSSLKKIMPIQARDVVVQGCDTSCQAGSPREDASVQTEPAARPQTAAADRMVACETKGHRSGQSSISDITMTSDFSVSFSCCSPTNFQTYQDYEQDQYQSAHADKTEVGGQEHPDRHGDEFLELDDDGDHAAGGDAAGQPTDTANPSGDPSHHPSMTALDTHEFGLDDVEGNDLGATGGDVDNANGYDLEIDEIDWEKDDDPTAGKPGDNVTQPSGVGEKRPREEGTDIEGAAEENGMHNYVLVSRLHEQDR